MKERVLCVDDEPNVLKALKRLFRDQPFHFITFSSPGAALKKIDEIKPAVVISDQRMPEMDGTRFLEAVKERLPDSVRIMLTGHADLEVALSAINQSGVFRFIRKPWNDEELKAQVVSAIAYYQITADLRALEENGLDEIILKRERMTGIRELASAVRHELGRSMAIVCGYSQLVQAHIAEESLLNRYLSNIVHQIKKMEELTLKITSIVRYETIDDGSRARMIDIDKASEN